MASIMDSSSSSNSNTTSQNVQKQTKYVRFAPKVQMKATAHYKDYSKRQHKACWVTLEEDKKSVKDYLKDANTNALELLDSGALPLTFKGIYRRCKRRNSRGRHQQQEEGSSSSSSSGDDHPVVAAAASASSSSSQDEQRKQLEYRRDYLYVKAKRAVLKEQHRQGCGSTTNRDQDEIARVYSKITQESIEMAKVVAKIIQPKLVLQDDSASSGSLSLVEDKKGSNHHNSSSRRRHHHHHNDDSRTRRIQRHYSNNFAEKEVDIVIPCI